MLVIIKLQQIHIVQFNASANERINGISLFDLAHSDLLNLIYLILQVCDSLTFGHTHTHTRGRVEGRGNDVRINTHPRNELWEDMS